jgi:hypothetical protein
MINAGKMLKGAIASAPAAPLAKAMRCRAEPCERMIACDTDWSDARRSAGRSERTELDMHPPRIIRGEA